MAIAKPTHPVLKAGQKVTHEKHGVGKIIAVKQAANGLWLKIDFGNKKNPNVKNVRPRTVTKV
jgi:hypothetical protein